VYSIVAKDAAFENREKSDNASITFRLKADAIARMKKEAADREIGMNTLLSQMIKHYMKWHSLAPRAGYIFVRRKFLMKLLERLSEAEVVSISEAVAKSTNKDILMVLRNKVNLANALDFIETWLGVSDIPFRHQNADNKHTFVIQHGMGRKWSVYMGELYRHMLEGCYALKFDYDAGENTLAFSFETPRIYQ
jgi:hypothetical protein